MVGFATLAAGNALNTAEQAFGALSSVNLGPVLFNTTEIPPRIRFGGAQKMHVHKLIGGARVIDAMGRDDMDIDWHGYFQGPLASERARILDNLRVEGQSIVLAWDVFSYTVVISEFWCDYEYAGWIPYTITCTVLQDNAWTPPLAAVTALALITNDVLLAAQLAPNIPPLPALFAAAEVGLGVAGAAQFGTSAYVSSAANIAGVNSGIATAAASANDSMSQFVNTNTAGILGTTDPVQAASNLGTASVTTGNVGGLALAGGYMGRAAANTAGLGN